MVEPGPLDEGMKNGHMAVGCAHRTNVMRFGDQHPHWIHGPSCEEKEMSKEEFAIILAHKEGDHENGNMEYECPICRTEAQAYLHETLTNLKKFFIPPFKEIPSQPEDAKPDQM